MAGLAFVALFAGAAVLGIGYSVIRLLLGEDVAGGETALQAGLGLLLSYMLWHFGRAYAQRKAVEAKVREAEVSANTKLVHYEALISFGVISFKLRSHYQVGKTRDRAGLVLCQLVTLLFGWWSIPMGPVDTVRTLRKNYRGGARTRALNFVE